MVQQRPVSRGSAAARARFVTFCVAACLLLHAPLDRPDVAAAQERPLPDAEAFLAESRTHLQTDQALQRSYAYVETRRELKLGKRGQTTGESVKVYESYPGLPGEERWERLIAEDGRPLPAKDLAKQDRDRQKKAQDLARRMSERPKQEYARQVRAYDEAQRERTEAVDDIFRVFDVSLLRREPIRGARGHRAVAHAAPRRAAAHARRPHHAPLHGNGLGE